MARVTLTTTTVRAADYKAAAVAIAAYREEGKGSNRSDWPRAQALLAAIFTVLATGKATCISDPVTVEIDGKKKTTPMFGPSVGDKPYHAAHRALSHGALRPYWGLVEIVPFKNPTISKGAVSGETDTKTGTAIYITPIG